MRQDRFPISIVCAVTAASSRKNFDKPSIATEKSFCNSKGVHSRSKQGLRIYKDHFALQNACWEIPNPFRSAPYRCRLRVFCKTLFQHSAGAHSHHGIVMIAGTGSLSQQANEHSRISFYMWIWPLCAQRHCLLLRFQLPFQNSTERVDIAKMWCPARSIILKLPGAWLHPAMINLIGNFCFYWLRWFSWL